MTDKELHNLLFHQFLRDWTYWGGHEHEMMITTDPWSDKQLKLAFICAIKKAFEKGVEKATQRKQMKPGISAEES